MMTPHAVPAASRSPACCLKPPESGTSILNPATSLATAGATSKPAIAPAATPSSSTTAIQNSVRTGLSSKSARCVKPRNGFCELAARPVLWKRHAMPDVASFRVKIFADGADRASILELADSPWIRGFTTNPTLMRKAGITDYESFGKSLAAAIPDRPFSFEVLSDDFDEMEQQALRIASWGQNVYVKIPITDTRGRSTAGLVARLSEQGVKVNVTALMTLEQVDAVVPALRHGPGSCISIFAGRIADTGCDPLPILCSALARIRAYPRIELIWASPRELFNIVQADAIGCHIITVTHDLLRKLHLFGRDLTEYSLDTVKMFVDDARAANFTLEAPTPVQVHQVQVPFDTVP